MASYPKCIGQFCCIFFTLLTFGPGAEPEYVVGVCPPLPVPALDDHLVLGGRRQPVEHKVARVREGVVVLLKMGNLFSAV